MMNFRTIIIIVLFAIAIALTVTATKPQGPRNDFGWPCCVQKTEAVGNDAALNPNTNPALRAVIETIDRESKIESYRWN